MANVTLGALRDAINNVDFPAGKDEIVAQAERDGASEDAIRALRSMPPVTYGSADEVIRSVTPDVGSGPHPQHDDPARQPTQPGIAQELR